MDAFGLSVGMEPHRPGGGGETSIGAEWERLGSVFGSEPHRHGVGTFIAAEWERLGQCLGWNPIDLGGGHS